MDADLISTVIDTVIQDKRDLCLEYALDHTLLAVFLCPVGFQAKEFSLSSRVEQIHLYFIACTFPV